MSVFRYKPIMVSEGNSPGATFERDAVRTSGIAVLEVKRTLD